MTGEPSDWRSPAKLKASTSAPASASCLDELLAEVDRLAADVKESRSYVMRKAIREGLPLVKTGGDALTLDGELSKDVDTVAKALEWTRPSVLIESVRIALSPLLCRNAKIGSSTGEPLPPEKIDELVQLRRETDPDWYPHGREMLRLRARLRAQEQLLQDLQEHASDAAHRLERMKVLASLRARPGGGGGGLPFGLSNEEIDRQIALAEKYGPTANWPEDSGTSALTGNAPRSAPARKARRPQK